MEVQLVVENLEVSRHGLEIPWKDDTGCIFVSLQRIAGYQDKLAQLKRDGRHTVTCLASVAVDCGTFSDLRGRIEPLRDLLCFVQRRSINFEWPDTSPPIEWPRCNERASAYDFELLLENEVPAFLSEALPSYLRTMSRRPALRNALLLYLASLRDGIWITERAFSLFLAIETLAEDHAEVTAATAVLAKSEFKALRKELESVVDSSLGTARDETVLLKRNICQINRRPIADKISALLHAHRQDKYTARIHAALKVRNDLAHRGVTEKLYGDAEERVLNFYEPFVATPRGCLERLFLSMLLRDTRLDLVDFSDTHVNRCVKRVAWPDQRE